ncbi:ABC transporter substrate-binding protein [Aidingimonas lacisalsi]|uniref:ABC transporter substrate-binding protein n=1 Tax=Aidingimonas lacisalsi TaxID=2604086 RepID=UPI001F180B81|nr:ABC transporter substrate-binding protein [Aidingimonas lacisalsi]
MVIALWGMIAMSAPLAHAETLRVGVLQFGTVSWELATVERHGLLDDDIELEIVPLASENALAVALQGGRVDLIVSDWLWVARQRHAGRAYQFAPFSLSVGAVMVNPQHGIDSLEALSDKSLGIAGGANDKTWLLLRAYAREVEGLALHKAVAPTFAAPPMINALMLDGKLPAAINFWHYNARLEAQGMQPLLTIESMLGELGIDTVPPLLGWVFADDWAKHNRQTLQAFLAATYEAKRLLIESDDAWEPLRPLVKPDDDAMFEAIKSGYREGVPSHYGDAQIDAAEQLFDILTAEGGSELAGGMQRLDTTLFWDGFRLP